MPHAIVLTVPGQDGKGDDTKGRIYRRAERTMTLRWRRQLRQVAWLRERPPLAPTGQCAVYQLGPLTLFNSSSNACELVRDADTVAVSDFSNHAMVVDMLHGSARGETGGQLVNLRRGDIGIFDLADAASFAVSECTCIGMLVPRDLLAGEVQPLALRESQLPTQMLDRHLRNTFGALPHAGTPKVEATVQATLSILQLCLDFAPALAKPKGAVSLRRTILAFIDENLDNIELGPEQLCRKFGISRTWLYKIFSAEGGVKRVIRDRRLDAAFRDLCNNPDTRIIDVAYRRAFSSERQFQRAFLAQFGVSPSAVRDARERAPSSEDDDVSSLGPTG